MVLVKINRIPTIAIIDSGAGRDFMNIAYAKDWGLPLYKKKVIYFLALGDGNLTPYN